MTGEYLFRSIGDIDEKYIEEAAELRSGEARNGEGLNGEALKEADVLGARRGTDSDSAPDSDSKNREKRNYRRFGTIAACLVCLAGAASAGVYGILSGGLGFESSVLGTVPDSGSGNSQAFSFMKNGSYDYLFIQDTEEYQEGEGAGRDNEKRQVLEDGSDSIAVCPYDFSRYFEDKRETLESENKIPRLDDYRSFSCTGNYYGDGELYDVEMSWSIYGDRDEYKHISVTAAREELDIVEDCIAIVLDDEGNPVEPEVCETVVDGVTIMTRGTEGENRRITFFKEDTGWYEIEGSWNVDNDELGVVLDWLWNNGIDFSGTFSPENGDEVADELFVFEGNSLYDGDYMSGDINFVKSDVFYDVLPAEFAACAPDFEALGWKSQECRITLRNGEPDRAACDFMYEDENGAAHTIWEIYKVDSSADEGLIDSYVSLGSENDLGDLSDLILLSGSNPADGGNGSGSGGDTNTDTDTDADAGLERVAEAVDGVRGVIIGFSTGKGESQAENGGDGWKYDYYYVTMTTGRMTAEQVWSALQTVYAGWRQSGD